EAELLLPFAVGDYVDFYSSLEHATNLGRLLRGDGEPLLPNWRHLPVGYHGRAGSVVVSGTPIVRPWGQRPSFGPTEGLDVDLEVELNGTVISRGNARGLYWTVPQQLAHATVNGAVARPGDLFASGTISGATPGSEGSLIELGRPFLADGDTVVLRGRS